MCPLTHDDIVQLQHFLQRALEHFCQYHSSCEENYLADLSVIIDCYSIVVLLSGTGYFSMPDAHFNLTQRYREFKQHPELIIKISFSLAQMINSIAEKVGLIEHPWFYPHFATAVKNILSDKITCHHGEMEVAQKLVSKILFAENYITRKLL